MKGQPAKYGYRVTVTMEIPSKEYQEWVLAQAFQFASEHWIGVTVHHKDNPRARVSCRTTHLRKPKEQP